jgi:hypothetical protein
MIHHKSVKLADHFYCYLWQGRGNNCEMSSGNPVSSLLVRL